MLVRKCSAGHPIKAYRKPYGVKEIADIGKMPDARFCVVSYGKVVYEGSSFDAVDQAIVDACADYHEEEEIQNGRWIIGKNKLENGVIVGLS